MQINSLRIEIILIMATPILAQYNGVRPDVTFGDHNDRFDVSGLISQQNKYFRADGAIDYRRSHGSRKRHKFLRSNDNPMDKKWFLGSERGRKKFAEKVKKETEEQLNRLANIILLRMNSMRRTGGDYAHHDDMQSDGADVYDFNENLAMFQRVTRRSDGEDNKSYRRIGTDPDMFNYAFPIDMKVNGYLLAPEYR